MFSAKIQAHLDDIDNLTKLFETEGFIVLQSKPRTDFGVVRLLFIRPDEVFFVMWSSHLQRLMLTPISTALDERIDLREAYRKLREMFPNSGYQYADPELREMFLGKPKAERVSRVKDVTDTTDKNVTRS